MTSAAFRDVAPTPNSLTQIGDGFSILIGPKLQSFVVDANVGKLELRFSEAVDLDSVDITNDADDASIAASTSSSSATRARAASKSWRLSGRTATR